jgi:hypothetical protein
MLAAMILDSREKYIHTYLNGRILAARIRWFLGGRVVGGQHHRAGAASSLTAGFFRPRQSYSPSQGHNNTPLNTLWYICPNMTWFRVALWCYVNLFTLDLFFGVTPDLPRCTIFYSVCLLIGLLHFLRQTYSSAKQPNYRWHTRYSTFSDSSL